MNLEHRKGIFKIVYSEKTFAFDDWYNLSNLVASQCVIVRAELMHMTNTIDYHAYSPLFDECKPGEFIPEYTATIKENEQGEIELIGFERIQYGIT
jgi:hypothetical protein